MYKTLNSSIILRLADNASIPADPANTDYAAYLRWLAEGNTPEPADAPPVPVITSVEMRQARLALLEQGLLTQVNNAVATMPGELGNKARIEWEFSNAVRRDKPLVQVVAASLGLTSQQIDDLFTLAATL
jgi:hypothetical protein